MQHRPAHSSKLDGLAIVMSLACMLHCLMLPLLVVVFPIIGATMLADDHFHGLLLVVIIPTSTLALYLGCRQHGDGTVLWLGLSGIGILAVAAVMGIQHLGLVGEKAVTCAGGVLLVVAHLLNFRRCRVRRCEENAARPVADPAL